MQNTNLQELSKSLDEFYDQQSRKLYEHIMDMGIDSFRKNGVLYKYKNTDLLQKLISHFESLEEYEKCSDLMKISDLID